MERVPEPEVMEDPGQARAYASADFSDVNRRFVDRFRDLAGHAPCRRVLDLGCGPGDIPVRLARAFPGSAVVAIDASAAMLRIAREAVDGARLRSRVFPLRARVPDLPFLGGSVDAIVSNSLLHHLPDPSIFWEEVRRLGGPGALLLVTDLSRPSSPAEARRIVEIAAGREHAILKRDFFRSLLAAFTPEEVRAQIASRFPHLECRMTSDRHWTVEGRL